MTHLQFFMISIYDPRRVPVVSHVVVEEGKLDPDSPATFKLVRTLCCRVSRDFAPEGDRWRSVNSRPNRWRTDSVQSGELMGRPRFVQSGICCNSPTGNGSFTRSTQRGRQGRG